MINCGYNDKKFLHLLSTVYLKYTEKEDLRNLNYMMYYFALLDLENPTFMKKSLEVLGLDLLCLKNYLEGNEDLSNLIGIHTKEFVTKLEDKYFKNVEHVKDKLKLFERIQYLEEEIFILLDQFTKMLWTISFYLSRLGDLKGEEIKPVITNAIEIFNILVSSLKLSEEEGVTIPFIVSNVGKVMQAYVFMLINTQRLGLKTNINIEFLTLKTLSLIDNSEEIFNYEEFVKYKEVVTSLLESKELDNFVKFTYQGNFEDINTYNLYKFLNAQFARKRENEEGKEQTELIFINDPYDYFETSMNHTGFNKLRKYICRVMKIKFIEIDYNEFLNYYKDYQITDTNLHKLVEEFLQFKLNNIYD